jgi:hypothetical protein
MKTLDDSTFLWGFLIVGVVLILTMKVFNTYLMNKLMDKFDKDSFFFFLTPEELVYLKTRSLLPSIYTSMLDLSENGLIRENPDKTVELMKWRKMDDPKEFLLLNELKKREIIEIKQLLSMLSGRKIFQNISNSMEAFVKFVHKSSSFHRVFLLNSIVYALFLSVGFIRLKLGILQKEPITYLIILIILFIVAFLVVLSSVSQSGFANSIKKYYKYKVLSQNNNSTNWKWNYYLVGTSVLASSLIPFIYNPKPGNSAGYGCSTCGGGSCGSSCGGGCGGCGG